MGDRQRQTKAKCKSLLGGLRGRLQFSGRLFICFQFSIISFFFFSGIEKFPREDDCILRLIFGSPGLFFCWLSVHTFLSVYQSFLFICLFASRLVLLMMVRPFFPIFLSFGLFFPFIYRFVSQFVHLLMVCLFRFFFLFCLSPNLN